MARKQKMDDNTLLAIIETNISNSTTYRNSTISNERELSLNYYRSELFGNEQPGRSKYVSSDVSDVVLSVIASLMKIFSGTESAVEFSPRDEGDEEAAKQRTDYINYIFFNDNEGHQVLYDMMMDALIQKTGICKTWWEEDKYSCTERYQDLTEDSYAELFNQGPELEILEQSFKADPVTAEMLIDVKVREVKARGKVRVEAVPPEQFFVNAGAKDIASAYFSCHQVLLTASELLDQGYDQALIDSLPTYNSLDNYGESQNRYRNEYPQMQSGASYIDKSMRQITVSECYLNIDWDGDGIAELRMVKVAGDSPYVLLDNEEIDFVPISDITPIRNPHQFYGRSLADLVREIQLIKSTVVRQMLDNAYVSNNQRTIIAEGGATDNTYNDLLSSRPGGFIRVRDLNSIMPFPVAPVGNQIFPLVEYFDGVREARTGVTRYNQGMDANSLNKTATGINALMAAANERKEMIARQFVEGFKRMFQNIARLVSTHQDKARTVRLRNKWVTIDPSEWKDGYDMSINVGLGTGNKDQQLMHLNNIMQLQEKLIMGGALGTLVTEQNIYNALSKIVENAGFKEPELFFTPPKPVDPVAKQQEEQAKQANNPETIKAQSEAQYKMADIQNQQMQSQADMQYKMQDLQLTHQERAAKLAFDQEKLDKEIELRKMEMALKYGLQAEKQADDQLDMHDAQELGNEYQSQS